MRTVMISLVVVGIMLVTIVELTDSVSKDWSILGILAIAVGSISFLSLLIDNSSSVDSNRCNDEKRDVPTPKPTPARPSTSTTRRAREKRDDYDDYGIVDDIIDVSSLVAMSEVADRSQHSSSYDSGSSSYDSGSSSYDSGSSSYDSGSSSYDSGSD